jgi:hypothetical protein
MGWSRRDSSCDVGGMLGGLPMADVDDMKDNGLQTQKVRSQKWQGYKSVNQTR